MSGQVTVTLGDTDYPVVPQRVGYLYNKLSIGDVAAVQDGSATGSQMYRFLTVLVPDYGKRVREHEFFGFESKDAQAKGEYDEAKDSSPRPDEVIDALEKVVLVSGGERIKNWLGPEMLRGLIRYAIPELLERNSAPSPSLPPPSGESDPTTSGPTGPTSEPPADLA